MSNQTLKQPRAIMSLGYFLYIAKSLRIYVKSLLFARGNATIHKAYANMRKAYSEERATEKIHQSLRTPVSGFDLEE